MTVKEFQHELADLLAAVLNLPSETEWRTRMNRGQYSPVVDVATGPFAVIDGTRLTNEHNDIFVAHQDLFYKFSKCHLENLGLISDDTPKERLEQLISNKMDNLHWTNVNGRCFVAIEIENNVSRKHLMGGAINCSVLGKIGIAVGFTESKHRAFLNLYRYFKFLQSVDKPTFNTNNLLIISKDQILEILTANL